MDFNKNEYYTPDIDEFHIGFEYEHAATDKEKNMFAQNVILHRVCHARFPDLYPIKSWQRKTFSGEFESSISPLKEFIKNGWIRVKHLNKPDIESLGYTKELFSMKYIMYGNEFLCMKKEVNHLIVYIELLSYHAYCYGTKMSIHIHNKDTMKRDETALLFNGNIKNKSELIFILKRLGLLN